MHTITLYDNGTYVVTKQGGGMDATTKELKGIDIVAEGKATDGTQLKLSDLKRFEWDLKNGWRYVVGGFPMFRMHTNTNDTGIVISLPQDVYFRGVFS